MRVEGQKQAYLDYQIEGDRRGCVGYLRWPFGFEFTAADTLGRVVMTYPV
jgi:hypothetical protein